MAQSDEPVINLDALTYAGNLENLASLQGDARHLFVNVEFGDFDLVARLIADHRPRAVDNFAAEYHVDRSIHGPEHFIQTNIVGTFRLLEAGQFIATIEKRQGLEVVGARLNLTTCAR